MNPAQRRNSGVIKDFDRDPLRIRCNTDGSPRSVSADHYGHAAGSMTQGMAVVGCGMFAIRIQPAVGPAAPTAGKVGMSCIDTGVHIGYNNSLAAESHLPELGGPDFDIFLTLFGR